MNVSIKRKAGPKIPDRIDLHVEMPVVPFRDLPKMAPGGLSSAMREHVIRTRNIADLAGSEKVESMHIAEAIYFQLRYGIDIIRIRT